MIHFNKLVFVTIASVVTMAAKAQNVGIGETNPQEMQLQIKRADSAVLLLHNSNNANGNIKTGLYYKTGNYYSGSIASIGAGGTYRMGLFTYGGLTPSALKERLTILDGGYVGIGTTSPTYLLDVNGRARLRFNGETSGLWFDNSQSTQTVFTGMYNDTTFGLYGNNAWRIGMDEKNGRIGIGMINPSAPLSFANILEKKISLYHGSTGDAGFGVFGNELRVSSDYSGANITFGYDNYTNGFTEKMRLTGSGNLGIGTNNPAAKLDVAGTVKIADGTEGAGKVLTSDANGIASWKNAPYGNKERFQFQLFVDNYNPAGLFDTQYNYGTATVSGTPNNQLFSIYISKPGLYHFDINFTSTSSDNFSSTGNSKFITITAGDLTNNKVINKNIAPYFYYASSNQSALCINKSCDYYVATPSTLRFSISAITLPTTYYEHRLIVAGNLISE